MPMSTLVTLLLKQISLTKSIPFDITLPEVPSSVNVDQMTPEEFCTMLVEGYHETDGENTRTANEFFDEFRKLHV